MPKYSEVHGLFLTILIRLKLLIPPGVRWVLSVAENIGLEAGGVMKLVARIQQVDARCKREQRGLLSMALHGSRLQQVEGGRNAAPWHGLAVRRSHHYVKLTPEAAFEAKILAAAHGGCKPATYMLHLLVLFSHLNSSC
jgi:hypothetical protein